MSLIYRTGDIFTTTLPAIGHGVNVRGLMGSGLAALVKKLAPSVEERYRTVCEAGELEPGANLPLYSPELDRWILNLASQVEPGADARLELLEEAVRRGLLWARERELSGVALPRIGSGVGGLQWDDVHEVLKALAAEYSDLAIELWTFEA